MTSHRKASVLARKRNLKRAIAPLVERLEERFLLATITYRFPEAGDDEWAEINYSDDIDATFIYLIMDEDNEVAVGLTDEPVPPPAPPDGEDAPTYGYHLYAVYVHAATLDSYISVTYRRADPGGIVTEPFGGNAATYWVANAQGGPAVEVSLPDGTGHLLLGGVSLGNNPTLYTTFAAPGPIGGVQPPLIVDGEPAFQPGLYVDDGVDLGRFLFGGTVTGQVKIGGSMELFAAGNVLTGISSGTGVSAGSSAAPDNFYVNGDLRDLVVTGSIGTHDASALNGLNYVTQFDFRSAGRVGQIRANNSFVGSVSVMDPDADNYSAPTSITRVQTEVETRGAGAAGLFLNEGRLGYGEFFNDNFDSAQYLGTINSSDLGVDNAIYVSGTLQSVDADNYRDWFDYYAVGLTAGQTVEVQLTDTLMPLPLIRVGVFDPDGRLIATDYSDVDWHEVAGQPFRFTADRPGVYRFAVASFGDTDFVTHEYIAGSVPYTLQISQITDTPEDANITLGGVVATNHIFDCSAGGLLASGIGFDVKDGNLGAIIAGGNVFSNTITSYMFDVDDPTVVDMLSTSIRVLNGDLRAVQGAAVGVRTPSGIGMGMDVYVPKGGVGLMRSTGDMLVVNDGYSYVPILGQASPITYVRDDYQLLHAATTFYGTIVTDRKLGTLRAGDMATLSPSIITVNANMQGEDGIIDLIDIAGNLGTLEGGGPWITTGPAGNVRYMNVGGDVYSDRMFGGGAPQSTVFEPGETAILNDDSGSRITLAPTGTGQLTITTYGIRGSGGVATIRVTSTSSLAVIGDARWNAVLAEIGHINITGSTSAANPSVSISGTASVDVFEITGGDFTSIINNTTGELVNITASSVGTIQAQTIGLAKASTPTAVNSFTVRSDAYPFSQQRIAVNVSGTIGMLSARQALGNIIAGSINQLVADSDSIRAPGTFDGIVAPVYTTGDMPNVDIGAGIASAGNGQHAHAGLFAEGAIGVVRGNVADIRGIVASNTSIGTIHLVGGSLINANILVGELIDVRELSDNWTMPNFGGTITRPTWELGQIIIEAGGTTPGDDPSDPGVPGGDDNSKRKYRRIDLRKRRQQKAAALAKAQEVYANTKAAYAKARRLYAKANTPLRISKSKAAVIRTKANYASAKKAVSLAKKQLAKIDAELAKVEAQIKADKKAAATAAILPGGIIGSAIGAADIQTIRVTNGFGIINSFFGTTGNGVIDRIEADGYGIRDVHVRGGAKVNNIIAVGNGKLIPVTAYSTSVRQQETQAIDPFFHRAPDRLTDLYAFFGDSITKSKPSLDGLTNGGVISNLSAVASRELGLLQGWRLQTQVGTERARYSYMDFGINFANTIRQIEIANDVSNVQILTGNLPLFNVGRDVNGLHLVVAGPIGTLNFGRHVTDTTRIHATGPSGTIDAIKINGNFAGWINAEFKIGTISIRGKWTGTIYENGTVRTR